jgi:hypothetical protein
MHIKLQNDPLSPNTDKGHDAPSEANTPNGQDTNIDNEVLPEATAEAAFLKLPLFAREQVIGCRVSERRGTCVAQRPG